jgi:alpha-methylacyl-CoA racemase
MSFALITGYMTMQSPAASSFQSLAGVRVLSLALNLPGPAALLRCRGMGATCLKFEPPARDPMALYDKAAYAALHEGIEVRTADLKTEAGQQQLHAELSRTDVLLTSFRPSALVKLKLDWASLQARHPSLSQVAIVGAPGERAEEPGHDLTYVAESGLVTGTELPPTLYADMGGALLASEAVLQATLHARSAAKASGVYLEVALNASADWLALPRTWGLTRPQGAVGGGRRARGLPRVSLRGRTRGGCRAGAALCGAPLRSRRRGFARHVRRIHARGHCRMDWHPHPRTARSHGARARRATAHARRLIKGAVRSACDRA